jgi:hypothetical protein
MVRFNDYKKNHKCLFDLAISFATLHKSEILPHATVFGAGVSGFKSIDTPKDAISNFFG